MDNNPLYVEYLKQDIEMMFGRTCKSPAEFKLLALWINKEKGESVSDSTLRRIWGYSKSQSKTRLSTLTSLARCLGFIDWDEYVLNLIRKKLIAGDTETAHSLIAKELHTGDRIRLRWNQEAEITIECIDKERFQVIEESNTKFGIGDTFKSNIFRKGAPIICLDIKRDGDTVGGKIIEGSDGITKIKYFPKN